MTASRDTLIALIEPVVNAMDLELWGVEFFAGRKTSVLRVFIDRESGVGVEDCARVSRQISALFDVEDPINGEYTLEVSSPGLSRPLYSLTQYGQYVGEIIDLQLRFPFEGRRKFKGELTSVDVEDIVLVVDDHEYIFPFDSIEKAKVVPRF